MIIDHAYENLPKMDTSKIAGMRLLESSIVVITISSNELTIQGSNIYLFFCYSYFSSFCERVSIGQPVCTAA